MKKRNKIIIGFIFLWVLFLTTSGMATTVKEVEEYLMCMCKDKCGKVLANCICKYSEGYRGDIALKLREGLTKNQVIQTFVDRYGEKVLSAPTKKGFNLVAWFTPFIAIILGGMGIRHVLAKWVDSKKEKILSNGLKERGSRDSDKYSSLLEKELKEFD